MMTDQEMVERYGVVLSESDQAPGFSEIMDRVSDAAARDRMKRVVADGRFDPAEHGLKGRAGFAGTGTFVGNDRKAGYL